MPLHDNKTKEFYAALAVLTIEAAIIVFAAIVCFELLTHTPTNCPSPKPKGPPRAPHTAP